MVMSETMWMFWSNVLPETMKKFMLYGDILYVF